MLKLIAIAALIVYVIGAIAPGLVDELHDLFRRRP